MLLVAHAYLIIVTENFSSFRSSSSSSFISLFVTANFTEYSRLLGEETSRNHQAYRKGHLDITILYPIKLLFFPCGIFPFSVASNISPLASAIGRMQINRRHTMAAEPQMNSPRTRALNSNLSVLISPLQNKRRHTLTTAALLNSARKAVDQAHRIAEQNKKKSIGHIEDPKESGAVREGPEKRTPLKPLNPRALRNNDERAASTPEGNIYLYRIRFLEYTIL